MQNIAVEIHDLTKQIEEQVILKGINLKVKKGEIYGLLGQNGAGKSTLMKIIFDIFKPSSGKVRVLGKTIEGDDYSIFKKMSGIIETPIFYQNFTARENLDIHCDYVGKEYKKDIDTILQLVGLPDVNNKKVKDYSMGMKQRLALGRAILCQPEILILDEPINGLDPKGVVDVRELLIKLKEEKGMTIFISSHIIAELEKVVDTIGIIHGGVFIEELSMKRVRDENIDLEQYFINILSDGEEK